MRKKLIVAVTAVVIVVLAVIGGMAIYATVGEATVDSFAGTWTIGDGSQAGYRVAEMLYGQEVTVVGRTDDVIGTVTVEQV